jgi:hypothetical protein
LFKKNKHNEAYPFGLRLFLFCCKQTNEAAKEGKKLEEFDITMFSLIWRLSMLNIDIHSAVHPDYAQHFPDDLLVRIHSPQALHLNSFAHIAAASLHSEGLLSC